MGIYVWLLHLQRSFAAVGVFIDMLRLIKTTLQEQKAQTQ